MSTDDTHEIQGKIVKANRLANTSSGNPKWEITLEMETGTLTLPTEPDADVGTYVSNYFYGDLIVVAHVRSGNIYRMTATKGSSS